MKLRIFSILSSVIVIGILLCLFVPVLQTGQTHFDFGEFPANQPLSGEFPISNYSIRTLKLNAVRSTCPCAKVTFPESLRPGETGKLKLAIEGNSYSGRFQGKIYLFSNAKGAPHEFTFSGLAVPLYTVSPAPELYLGGVRRNSTEVRKFIIDAGDTDPEFGQAQYHADCPVEVHIRRLRAGKYEAAIRLRNITAPQQNFSFSVEIPISRPSGWPPVKFLLSGRVTE